MTTAMHTPGPWSCSGGSFDDADGIAYTIHADGMVISRANARLIAAAPDLLLMVAELSAALQLTLQMFEIGIVPPSLAATLVAKATGK
jgi:hypothetical protein